MFKFAALVSLVALIPAINAQQQVWGQCGGNGWSGPTTCVSGSTCTKLNDWYSQCIPGSNPPQQTTTTATTTTTTQPPTTTPGGPGGSAGNPFANANIYISPFYADEVDHAVTLISDASLKAKAAKVKDIPTFIWFDKIEKIPTLDGYLKESSASGQLLQIVVYDLPNRDCHAKASNGELLIDNDGVNKYKHDYIDKIVETIKKYPNAKVVAVVEPDSLANLVTNLSDPNCQKAQPAYLECTNYAIKALASVGVSMYLDAGHAGWLGWPANLTPAAELFARVFKDAGSPPQLRGLATNVANYNALRASSPDPATPPNPNYDEIHYIEQLAPALRSQGFPANFIVDQGRSGVQNIRDEWGNWCNIQGAGFGTRPTTSTGSSLIDAIVWIKPGGESDGTSDTSATRYDSTCGLPDAHKPAPEAGQWFQDYFVALVRNANPPL